MWLFCLFMVIQYSLAQVNLSPNGTAKQSSTYKDNNGIWSADFAIDDGGPTHDWSTFSCTHTADDKKTKVWWMVSFEEQLYISNVVIYYRKDYPGRLAGYSLYVTNKTISNENIDFSTGHLCYHHTGSVLPNILQNVTCDRIGSNVIIYNERLPETTYPSNYMKPPFLELCDVQVIGCEKGFSGGGCRFSCPGYCIDQHCNPTTGDCIWGCMSSKCFNSSCVDDGKCINGCPKGTAGLYCDKKNIAASRAPVFLVTDAENQKESFVNDGDKRKTSCVQLMGQGALIQIDTENQHVIKYIYIVFEGITRNDTFRIHVTNTSMDVSQPVNITAQDLNIIIDPLKIYEYTLSPVSIGRYVIASFVSHSANSFVDVCELEIFGCLPGFNGHLCEFSCLENCNGPCDPKSGQCVFGCKDGYRGDFCDNACQPPQFGPDCSKTCNCIDKQENCNFIDGTCPPGGCEAGWEGTSCSSRCKKGYFGKNCQEKCDGCILTECAPETGVCKNTTGCNPGWKKGNEKCDIACDDGYFDDCTKACFCLVGVCDKPSGVCKNGECELGWMLDTCSEECTPGQYGYNCAETCDTCNNTSCERLEGNCTDGCVEGYYGVRCQFQDFSVSQKTATPKSPNAGAIGGGIGGASITIIVVVVIIFIVRRKSTKKDPKYTENTSAQNGSEKKPKPAENRNDYANVDPISLSNIQASISDEESDKENAADSCIYGNTEESGHEIAISDIQVVIAEKRKHDLFEEEFESFPKGLLLPHDEGSKEDNKVKNRFLTTWPYDHSRVILKEPSESDYINASYLDNYTKEKAYIATQGPKQGTVEDFWQMIWQENVEIIVMVTKLEENGKKKCYQYWPKSKREPLITDHYKVTLVKESDLSVYCHRTISICEKDRKAERTIHHFSFLEWPDHGVPDKISLIHFYRKVKHVNRSLGGPLVVHCSAGVGRTGTFCAIDALYENGLKTGKINVYEYVDMMRKDRMNMIQTKDQYATVFEALLEAFTVPDFSMQVENLSSFMDDQNTKRTPRNQRSIQVQFKKIKDLKPNYSKDVFKAGKNTDNISKNRNQQILPHDKYRPYLMSYEKSSNDYINAVIIPSFPKPAKILATQFPLKSTVVDFWTLVYDNDLSTVVILEEVDEQDVQILPEVERPLNFKLFTIEKTGENSNYINVRIIHKDTKTSKNLKVVITDNWPAEDQLPPSEDTLLDLNQLISNQNALESLAVVCSDGCSRSGIFIAVHLTLKKLQMDNEVDLFHIVRTLQIRRPEFIADSDQFEFCYNCVRKHLDTDSLYANV